MSFHEVRLNEGLVIYDSEGGPLFSTDIARMGGGGESRNANWDEALGTWNVGDMEVTNAELATIQSFFRARKGRWAPFRWKDWGDFECSLAEGVPVAQDAYPPTGFGNGMPTYDCWKKYSDAAATDYRRLFKLVAGTTAVQRNGVPVAVGVSAGNISIDPNTGRFTFVADATSNASSITVGATTQVVLSSNPGSLVAGKALYLSGFAGADAGLVNGLAHPINSVTGSGPYTFTLAVNTAGKTITLGTGQGRKYPQASDALTFSCEFDCPVRFDTDQLRYRFIGMSDDRAVRLYYLSALPLVLVRDPLA